MKWFRSFREQMIECKWCKGTGKVGVERKTEEY